MSRVKKSDSSRWMFGKMFSELFEKGKREGKWNSQEDFGQVLDPNRPASRGSVSNWCKGKDIPTPDRLKQICEIFGVNEDYFKVDHLSPEEKYKLSIEYMTKTGHEEIVPYCKEIGLDLLFVNAVRSLFGSDFDEVFPLWTPIGENPKMGMEPFERRRDKILATSAPMTDGLNIFQMLVDDLETEKKKRVITLSRADLSFLRDVQEEVREYIEFLFVKRSKDQKKEVEEANLQALVPIDDNQFEIRRDKADLNQIDKYFHGYTNKKNCVREYIKMKPKASGIRQATQEDWDRFFEGKNAVIDKDGVRYELKEGE